MNFYLNIFFIILFINSSLSIITVFLSNRDVSKIWAWLVVLIFIPGIGFVIYWFAGRGLSNKKIFSFINQNITGKEQIKDNQKFLNKHYLNQRISKINNLFTNKSGSILTYGNRIQTFFDGSILFKNIFKEIKGARHHIHISSFTINNDKMGNQLVDLLTKKAQEGVEIRVIYDAYGSHGTHNLMYHRLRKAGGIIYPFLTRRFQLLSYRINFRFHRKITVIDGKIGYIGGFNFGDQYEGNSNRFSYWRDSHLKIRGDSVLSLQSQFFTDWNSTAKKKDKLSFSKKYFPSSKTKKINYPVQIISSGPDSTSEIIKKGYLTMINSAVKSIVIQTPYLIPDQSIFESIIIALSSGIKINIFIPRMPDHPFVYRATEYYAREFQEKGAKIYRYDKGFLHSKLILMDDEVTSIGSANMDIRSFELGFEANAFIFSRYFAKKIKKQLKIDAQNSTLLNKQYFKKQSVWRKFKQNFCRLLSPLL